MKFENLKDISTKPVSKRRVAYWTKERCESLARTFYILDDMELRKLFGGRSLSTIKAKASKLRQTGWNFKC